MAVEFGVKVGAISVLVMRQMEIAEPEERQAQNRRDQVADGFV